MATNTLSILKPSVNNLTTRIFVRAAGLDFDETDVWGKKSTPEFLAKDPADLTPLLEEAGLPKGSPGRAARSCSTSATSTASTSSIRPTRASGRWWTARCSTSSARSTRPRARDAPEARVRPVPGRGRDRGGLRRAEGEGAEEAEAALAGPLDVYRVVPRR